MSRALRHTVPVTLGLGLRAWLAPASLATAAGSALVGLLIVVPVSRVGWLVAGWMRFDHRYAAIGGGLLGTLAAAATIAVALR